MNSPLITAHLDSDDRASIERVAAWLDEQARKITRTWNYHSVPLPSPRWQRRWRKAQELGGGAIDPKQRSAAMIDRQVNEILARDLNRSADTGFRNFLHQWSDGAVTPDMIALVRGSADAHAVVSAATVTKARSRVLQRVEHRQSQLAHFAPKPQPRPASSPTPTVEPPTVTAPRIVVRAPGDTRSATRSSEGGALLHNASRAQRELITAASTILGDRDIRTANGVLRIDDGLAEAVILTPDSYNMIAVTARLLVLESVPDPWRPAVRKDLDRISNAEVIAAALYAVGLHTRVLNDGHGAPVVHLDPLGR